MPEGKHADPQTGLGIIASRPAVLLAGLLIVGIVLHERVLDLQRVSVWIEATLILLALLLTRYGRIATALLGCAAILMGAQLAQLQHFRFADNHITHFATETPRLVMVELELDQPARILSGFGQFRSLPPKQVTTAKVRKIRGWDDWIDVQGGILVQIDQPHPRLAQGQIVRVLGLLQRPSPSMNPGQFDWATYYRQQGILASINVPNAGNIQILEEQGTGVLDWAREKARRLLAIGFPAERSLDHALLRALLLGDNDPELRDVQEQFRRTGTSHHLSISGLHVAVLGGFVLLLCRMLNLAPTKSLWIMSAFVLLYGLVAMPSPPVIRSVLLTLCFSVGILNRRSVDALQLLALSAVLMLCWKPMDVFNAGFQLSFGTVLGLIVLTNRALEWFESIDQQTIATQNTFAGWRMRQRMKLRMVLVTGLVAWGVSLPLIAYHFEQLNPWAIAAGIVLAPVVFVALIGGLLKVMLSILLPGFSTLWAAGATVPMILMRHTLDVLARLPGSEIPLPAPSVGLIVTFYALLILPFLPWTKRRFQIVTRFAPLAGALLILIVPLRANWSQYTSPVRQLRVTLLAVGAGQCCVIEPPGAPATLIDVGSTSLGSDLLRKCVGPFLRHDGRREIARILLTHGDYDHISAAYETSVAFDVKEILTSPHFRRHSTESAPAENLLDALDRQNASPRQVAKGDRIDLGGEANLAVLWPTNDTDFNSNNCGLVMKLTYAGRTILLPADIQDPTMKELLKSPDALKADVLVAPHHGSFELQTPTFINAVDPKIVLSSNDRTLTNKQIRFEKMLGNRELYRTNRVGAITVVIDSNGKLSIDTHLKR